MSELSLFLKENKKARENVFYAPTASILGEDGKPALWELRHLTARENDALRESCTQEIAVKGKKGAYRQKLDTSAYVAKIIVAATVSPNLYDKALQDSYGVMKPEDLLRELVDSPGEYTDFAAFVQEMNGFTTLEEDVEAAKN